MKRLPLAVAAFVACAALSNYLSSRYRMVDVGLGLTASAGTFTAGLALGARDLIQRWGGRWASLAAIAAGSVLSLLVGSSGRIALASCCAFAVSELVDLGVFSAIASRFGPRAGVLGSNVVSAPVDSVVFLGIVGWFTWPALLGQFVGKIVWATCVPLAVEAVVEGATATEPVTVRTVR